MKSIKSSVKRFISAWNKSVELKYEAAVIYAEACDTWSLDAKRAFHDLATFSAWTPMQWTLLYYIGKNVIPACYINFVRPTLPLAMRRHKVSYEEMEQIYYHGANLADINGKLRNVSVRVLQIFHISQLFDEEGHRRSVLQQMKFINDRQTPNYEVLDDGTIHVRHHCYITKTALIKILTDPDKQPLSASELFMLAQKVNR